MASLRQPPPGIQDALAQAAAETGVPLGLLTAVAFVESRYDATAVSPVGAQGLLQLMPRTADALNVADPFDPYQNARGGARFLRRLHDKYGDWDRVLAAYNWGPGNVDSGKPWPTSVKTYVANVTARWPQYQAPVQTRQLLARFWSKILYPYPALRRG